MFVMRRGSGSLEERRYRSVCLREYDGLRRRVDGGMAKKAAENVNIGGGANISFSVSGDGETLKVSGFNMAMYGVCQSRITEEVWESQKLPGMSSGRPRCRRMMTSRPQVSARTCSRRKSLTHEVPRWFGLTFRLDALPAQSGKLERHILYLGNHLDTAQECGGSREYTDTP